MTLAAGDYFPGASIEYMKAGSTIAIAKGALLMWDTTGDGWLLATSTTNTLGPFAVCVEAKAAGGTQVLACTRGKVAVTTSGTLEPNDVVQPSTSTAGRVQTYTARATSASNAMSEGRRLVGRFISDSEDLGDGTIAVDAAQGDVVIIDLGGVT